MLRSLLVALGTLVFASAAFADVVQYDIRVDGITCPFCLATSEKELKKIDGITMIEADLETGVISVCADESVSLTDAQLRKLFLDKGFTFRGFKKLPECSLGDDRA